MGKEKMSERGRSWFVDFVKSHTNDFWEVMESIKEKDKETWCALYVEAVNQGVIKEYPITQK